MKMEMDETQYTNKQNLHPAYTHQTLTITSARLSHAHNPLGFYYSCLWGLPSQSQSASPLNTTPRLPVDTRRIDGLFTCALQQMLFSNMKICQERRTNYCWKDHIKPDKATTETERFEYNSRVMDIKYHSFSLQGNLISDNVYNFQDRSTMISEIIKGAIECIDTIF